jgi:hypothetical protein
MKADHYQKTYGPSKSKTYETSLFNLIQSEFGYIGGPDVVKLFVQKICDLNREYYKQAEYIKPGEMRYLALKAGQKYSRGRKLSEMQLLPVTLTVVAPEDIDDRVNKLPRKERMKKITARLLREAKAQGAVLSETDVAIIFRVSGSAVSNYVREYEKEHRAVLPRPGSEMDIGKTLTHKKLAFQNYKKKLPTSDNARLIDHSPESVDRYIKDGTRVEKLYETGYTEWEISFFTGLPGYVVRQYVETIEEFKRNEEDQSQ